MYFIFTESHLFRAFFYRRNKHDDLQGKYPKDFQFTGWHPHCRCFVTTILKTQEEMEADSERRLNGEEAIPPEDSENYVGDVPEGFKTWLEDNKERIASAKSLPYFMRDNVKYTGTLTQAAQSISSKINILIKPADKISYVSFEPFSPIVAEKMMELRDVKKKLRLFNEIINDSRAVPLNTTENAKTVIFEGHKSRQHATWKGTRQMATDLNNLGEGVAFLPELGNKTSTDSLVLFRGKPVLADFKYCTTTNINTLAKDLEYGFTQASTIVLKNPNMDAGTFKGAIDYLVRNDIPYGNIKLLNQYGKQLELAHSDIKLGKYKKKIKGFF